MGVDDAGTPPIVNGPEFEVKDVEREEEEEAVESRGVPICTCGEGSGGNDD